MTINYTYMVLRIDNNGNEDILANKMTRASEMGYEEYQHPVAMENVTLVFFRKPKDGNKENGPYRSVVGYNQTMTNTKATSNAASLVAAREDAVVVVDNDGKVTYEFLTDQAAWRAWMDINGEAYVDDATFKALDNTFFKEGVEVTTARKQAQRYDDSLSETTYDH